MPVSVWQEFFIAIKIIIQYNLYNGKLGGILLCTRFTQDY